MVFESCLHLHRQFSFLKRGGAQHFGPFPRTHSRPAPSRSQIHIPHVVRFVESLPFGSMKTPGLIYNGGWRKIPFSAKESKLLNSGIQLAARGLHIDNIVTVVLMHYSTLVLPIFNAPGVRPSQANSEVSHVSRDYFRL